VAGTGGIDASAGAGGGAGIDAVTIAEAGCGDVRLMGWCVEPVGALGGRGLGDRRRAGNSRKNPMR